MSLQRRQKTLEDVTVNDVHVNDVMLLMLMLLMFMMLMLQKHKIKKLASILSLQRGQKTPKDVTVNDVHVNDVNFVNVNGFSAAKTPNLKIGLHFVPSERVKNAKRCYC